MTKIFIDSDILVYKVGHSVESPIYVVKGGVYKRKGYAELMSSKTGFPVKKRLNIGSLADLKQNLKSWMMGITEALGGHNHQHFLTSSKVIGNFRDKIATIQPYKGNRVDMKKPFYYHRMRQIFHDEYGAMLVHGQEADDQITIEHFKLYKEFGHYDGDYIVTIDKDFKQVPGNHYNPVKQVIYNITEAEAFHNFYGQLLEGDITDNIPGLTKTLKIRGREEEANKLSHSKHLAKFKEETVGKSPQETFDYIYKLYTSFNLENEMWEIGNLLWLRRYEGQLWSDDFKAGKIH